MTPKEIRKKKKSDLEALLRKFNRELAVMNLNIKMGDIGALKKARQMKKDVARILTILNEKGEEAHG